MSEDTHYVPVKFTGVKTPANSVRSELNAIHVKAMYNARNKSLDYSCYPCEIKNGIVSIVITAGAYKYAGPMARNNKKKVEEANALVREQLRRRIGLAWSMVEEMAAKQNLEVTPAVVAETEEVAVTA